MARKTDPIRAATFSWLRALRAGTLTELQLETLQAAMDIGDDESLEEAAQRLDYEATHRAGPEPGPVAY
jgi:hypothetical protein